MKFAENHCSLGGVFSAHAQTRVLPAMSGAVSADPELQLENAVVLACGKARQQLGTANLHGEAENLSAYRTRTVSAE